MRAHRPATAVRNVAAMVATLGLVVFPGRTLDAQTLAVSASPGSLRISTALTGSAPTAASDATTTYTTSTPLGNPKKITVQLNSSMPAGLTLTVNLTAVPSSNSTGTLTLTTTAQDAVTGISNSTLKSAGITYGLSATSAAGVIASSTRTVTLTLVVFP